MLWQAKYGMEKFGAHNHVVHNTSNQQGALHGLPAVRASRWQTFRPRSNCVGKLHTGAKYVPLSAPAISGMIRT